MPGLNLKRHAQTNGHVNNDNYSNTPSNNTNCPQSFNNSHFPSDLLGGSEHVHRTSWNPYQHSFFSSLSDLMKSTEVDESLSTTTTNVLFQR